MFQGETLADAMVKARRCPEVKERHFSTPTAMAAACARVPNKRPFGEISEAKEGKSGKGYKGGGKGEGAKGGKAKGDKKGTSIKVLHSKTPDGRNICFRFQSKKCNSSKCHFVHVCSTCLAEGHGAGECPTGHTQ